MIPAGIKFDVPPPQVGGYFIGEGSASIGFMLTKKPIWAHRLFVKFFLGWNWRDVPTVTEE